jgi:hypothetical protein
VSRNRSSLATNLLISSAASELPIASAVKELVGYKSVFGKEE